MSIEVWARHVEYRLIDRDRAYGAQCWDLSADWAEYATGCTPADFWTLYDPASPDHTLASSIWLYWPVKPGITKYFTRHGRHEEIRAGDILFWARSAPYPASHTAVALGPAGPKGVPCMTQNPGAAQRAMLPAAGFLGFLRPIAPTPAPTPRKRPRLMFDLYLTGPTVESTGQNVRILLPYGSFHVPTDQLHQLLRRRRGAMLNATAGTYPDQMLDVEHSILGGFLQACNRAAAAGIELDPVKFRAALSDALGTTIDYEAKLDPAQLAAAFDEAVPRIVASLMRQAGQKLAGEAD